MDRLPDAAARTAGRPRFLFVLAAALIAAVGTAAWLAPWDGGDKAPAAAHASAVSTDTARVLTEAATQRPVYKYSVLPGGVGSRQELAGRAAADKVAAAHYASFEIDKAHVTVVPRARAVHVSYRKGDRIYWTKGKVTLAAGETLLSDGRSSMRTRCGNRISETPQLPVEASGPGEGELDTIVPTSADVPEEGSPGLPPGVYAFASGAHPDTGTPPARTRTSVPMPAPAGFGIPGGGPVYGFDPGPGPGTETRPAPGDSTVPGSGPANPGNPLLPPPGPVPEPQPPRPHPDPLDPPVEVPEPGTLWLGAAGAVALLLRRRR